MKRTVFFLSCLLILQSGILVAGSTTDGPPGKSVNEVTVASGSETRALATAWIEAFKSANPEIKVSLVTDEDAMSADIRIISSNSLDQDKTRNSWKIIVGRDVIVPLMSRSDPFLESVSGRGISPAEFAAILSSDGSYTWGNLLGTGSNTPVTVIIPEDNAALNAISGFASVDPMAVRATRSSSESSLIRLSQGKEGVILFCRLADVTDKTGMEFIEGMEIVPVDINGNALSDYFEQFYSSFDNFVRGVYIGKYPKSLCNNVYAISEGVPARGAPSDFISFILIEGQGCLNESGFTALARGEGVIRMEALADDQAMVTPGNGTPVARAWIWILSIIAAVSLFSYLIYIFTRPGIIESEKPLSKSHSAFSPQSIVTPAGILYDKGHAWTFMEKDGKVRVGIDDFLLHITGSITRIRMRSNGEKIRKGEFVMSVVQNGKQLDIMSPLSGIIIARNERLMNDTAIVHSSPYETGWVYLVAPDNWEKESRMMSAASKYAEFLKDEFTRIKDFLAGTPGINEVSLAQVILQDGGELSDGFLEEFGPEIWEEFQSRFLHSIN
jgi:glycine cleavage system H lipoate-binding protein